LTAAWIPPSGTVRRRIARLGTSPAPRCHQELEDAEVGARHDHAPQREGHLGLDERTGRYAEPQDDPLEQTLG